MEKLEIKGKVNTAICYAKVVEQDAIEQIRRMCDHEFTEGSQIRIMPDVHSRKGCTIGTTMTVVDKAVPNIVGVDIGCGMLTINIGKNPIDFEKLDAAAHYIPSGMNVWEGRKERFDLEALRCYRELKRTKWLERSLGTLGGDKWQQGLAMPNIDNLVVLASLLGVKIDDIIVTDKQNYIKIGAYRITIERAVEKKVQREMIRQNYTTSSMT